MARLNGLDTITYGVTNGGLVSHNSIDREFMFGPIYSIGKDIKLRSDPVKYYRFDSTQTNYWNLANFAFCGIASKDIISSTVRLNSPIVSQSLLIKKRSTY